MTELNLSIAQLLEQIRLIESHHNQFVDQYFLQKEKLNKALNQLNGDPNGENLFVYNKLVQNCEDLMKIIRHDRMTMTNLVFNLQERGVSLNDDDDDDDQFNESSSIDEGIDEHSSSFLDQSSKISIDEPSELIDE